MDTERLGVQLSQAKIRYLPFACLAGETAQALSQRLAQQLSQSGWQY